MKNKEVSLSKFFNPKSIAIVGASNRPGSVGCALMKNIAKSSYPGSVFPVNPKRKKIMGLDCFASISGIKKNIDLVIIATPAKTVPGIVEECGKAGVFGVIIISAGFKEVGGEGVVLFNQLIELQKKYGIRILGPNCLGFIRPSAGLNASFANKLPKAGKVAFISQSGALGTAVLDWAVSENVGFSCFVSTGSILDLDIHDLLDYFAEDKETSSILVYMESLTDAKKFLAAATNFSLKKPIVLLKVGKSSEGAKAAVSHTGSVTGDDAVFDAAFKKAGIVRVETVNDFFDCAQILAMQKLPLGDRLLIVTNAGGPGVITTDYLIGRGGKLAQISLDNMKKLNSVLPAAWSHNNPVDLIGDADFNRYKSAVELCLNESGCDGVLVILTPQEMTNPSLVAKTIASLPSRNKKTLLASWMGARDVDDGREILEKNFIPCFDGPERAVRCFLYMANYSKNKELLSEAPGKMLRAFKPKVDNNKRLLNKVVKDGRFFFTECEAKEFLSNYEIPVAKGGVAKNSAEASKLAESFGFPVVMKISSPNILHKTDVGGVKLNIKSKEEVKKAFDEIMSSVKKNVPKAKLDGIFVEAMTSKKYEVLIGCKKDPLFGPVVVFGMGGFAVEVFRDVSVGLPPLTMSSALRLMENTKVFKLLKGYRGVNGVDVQELQFLLCKFSNLVLDFPQIKEIDINPFGVDENGGLVLDAKIVLDEKVVGKKYF
jgi:acetyltransferase